MANHRRRGKASRNHKGCGICKPYKRVGNGRLRYSAKEWAKRNEFIDDDSLYPGYNEGEERWIQEQKDLDILNEIGMAHADYDYHDWYYDWELDLDDPGINIVDEAYYEEQDSKELASY